MLCWVWQALIHYIFHTWNYKRADRREQAYRTEVEKKIGRLHVPAQSSPQSVGRTRTIHLNFKCWSQSYKLRCVYFKFSTLPRSTFLTKLRQLMLLCSISIFILSNNQEKAERSKNLWIWSNRWPKEGGLCYVGSNWFTMDRESFPTPSEKCSEGC